jgi:hypothetical protein
MQLQGYIPAGDEALKPLIVEWLELRNLRLKNEKVAEEIKKGVEAQAEARILSWLAQHGVSSSRVAGLGTVARRGNLTVMLTDADEAWGFMYDQIKQAESAGAPLTNHLFLQKRAH